MPALESLITLRLFSPIPSSPACTLLALPYRDRPQFSVPAVPLLSLHCLSPHCLDAPRLLCLNTSDLADLALPQLSVPALPFRNSSRHSLEAMPAAPALDNPQRNAPLHSCLDPSQLTVPIRCLPQLPLLSCLASSCTTQT